MLMVLRFAACLFCGAVAFAPACGVAPAPQRHQDIVLLAIDDHLLPFRRNLCYYLSRPRVRKEPVLVPSRDDANAADQLAAHFYGTVIVDEGRFRMWYYPVRFGARTSEMDIGPAGYAESEDGIHWIKPSLRQVSIKGNLENNAIDLADDRVMGVTVIKDEEETDPERRYKMVYNPIAVRERWAEPKLNGAARSTLRTATSRDGLTWTARPDLPLDVFVELSSFYKHDGLFVAHGQGKLFGEGGELHGRRGYAWVSTDFEHWLAGQAETFGLPEPGTLGPRGAAGEYDQVHLGVGGASYGSVVVGLYGIWRQGGTGVGGTTCDLGLVVSNDGIHFREPVKKHVYISRHDSPVTPVAGKDYPTILCQANGILNVDDETWIYHGRWRNAPVGPEYYGEVALATLPRDRWGAVGLIRGVSEGWVWSAPLRWPEGGAQVYLNADFAPQMRVEVSDVDFNLLPDFSDANAGTVSCSDGTGRFRERNGGLDCSVVWPGAQLSDLAGRQVRLRVQLTSAGGDPRLYAVYVRESGLVEKPSG